MQLAQHITIWVGARITFGGLQSPKPRPGYIPDYYYYYYATLNGCVLCSI